MTANKNKHCDTCTDPLQQGQQNYNVRGQGLDKTGVQHNTQRHCKGCLLSKQWAYYHLQWGSPDNVLSSPMLCIYPCNFLSGAGATLNILIYTGTMVFQVLVDSVYRMEIFEVGGSFKKCLSMAL